MLLEKRPEPFGEEVAKYIFGLPVEKKLGNVWKLYFDGRKNIFEYWKI